MTLRRRALLLLASALLWPLTACEHHFFTVHGSISSEGGAFGTWNSTPEGCTRDPADDLPLQQTKTLATLVWRDLRIEGERVRDYRLPKLQNTPLRLELTSTASIPSATLQTMLTSGVTLLDSSSCSALQIATHEGPPAIGGGKPTLGGQVKLDCVVRGSHLRADIAFAGCEY